MAFNKLNVIIGAKLEGFEKAIQSMERNLRSFQRNMQNIGRDLTQSVSLPLAGLGVASVRSFAQVEKLEKGLAAMMGSAEAAREEMKRLRVVAELPGLGFQEAIQGSVRLQAVKFNAEEARQTMLSFGKAIAVTGGGAEDLDAVTRQITQMVSKNRILQEDFQVLQDRVPLIGQALQNAFGTTNIERIRESGISAKEFTTRLTESLGALEQVKNAQGGLGLAFENFGDSIQIILASLGKEINKIFDVEGALNRLSQALQSAVDWFINLDDNVKRNIITFAAVTAAIGPALLIIGKLSSVASLALLGMKNLAGGVRLLGSAVAFLLSPIGLIVAGIAALAAGAVIAYSKFENFRRGINAFIEVGKELAQIAKESLGAIFDGFSKLKEGKFREAAKSFKEAIIKGNPIGVAFTQGERLGEAFREGFADDSNRLQAQLDKLKNMFKSTAKEVGNFIPTAPAGLPTTPGGGGGTASSAPQVQSPGISNFNLLPPGTLEQVASASIATGELKNSIEGLVPALATVQNQFSTAIPAAAEWRQQVESMGLAVNTLSGEAIPSLSNAVIAGLSVFGQLAEQGITSFKSLARAVVAAGKEIISSLIQQGVAAAITNTLRTSGKVIGPFAIALAGAAGAAASALFKSVLGKVGKFADGGIVYGPTLGLIGEYSGARSNPEVVAPLDKLKSIIGGGAGGNMMVEVVGVLQGEDIYLATVKAAKNNNRFGNSQLVIR